ncbi:hypothetical protein ACHAXT_003552 [Thalassiosira profunda]
MASDVGETVDWCCSLHISGESDALLEGVIPANVVANDAGETLCQRCASHAGAVVVDLAPGDEFAGFGTRGSRSYRRTTRHK